MKTATLAPAFAVLYPGLCDIARRFGYALAIHGTVTADLDLIAVPWIAEAHPAGALVEALRHHLGACLDIADWGENPEMKPHGRIAWNLYIENGSKVDLSVMPLIDTGGLVEADIGDPDAPSASQ